MKMMNHGRAAGPDGITIEALIALGDWGISQITDLLNIIYDNGEIPEEMCKSVFIMLPKKEGATECSLHRPISLMSDLTKLLLRINTTNYAKILNSIDIDGKDLSVVRNLYWDQAAATRIDDKISEYIPIKRGVRQGCVLSPDFFNIYSEMILRNIYDLKGIRIDGVNINNLHYADDTVLLAKSVSELQAILNVVTDARMETGLDLNAKKTECMTTSKNADPLTCNLTSKGEKNKQVSSFKYWGYTISSNGKCLPEVKRRIAIAEEAFFRMRPIIKSNTISLDLKVRLTKTYVWSILIMYGCERWTLDKETIRRIEAAEMWFLRRILKISWAERTSNEEVLRRAGIKKEAVHIVRKRQLSFVGHIYIYRKDDLERLALTGRVQGKRDRVTFLQSLNQGKRDSGRQRVTFLHSLNQGVTQGTRSKTEFLRLADDREECRLMTADVCNRPGN
ncbi:endonuclease-reverse transcriptase [Elysia marginata]|uniref:Endonuclease-reverse transcriptase n=1 Tax=Elysia marginata TaxID=1093978 RepID=A0AAV4E9Y3_9GAST|nr:endonuclease-reverse transcriptase [Elysia marginata]